MNPVPVPDPPVGLATQELVASPPPLPEHLVIPKEAPIKAIPATPAETLPTGLASPPNFAIFGHAHDYRWISGEAQKWDDGWRLRYAMPDEIDPYGGRIALVGEEHLWHLQDGEFYKLVGRLVPVDGQAGGVAFHVDIVQLAAANISSAEPATVPLNQIK
jgi:hypothetical protein